MEESKIICICYKWYGEDKVHTLKWDKNQCDKKMLIKFSKALIKADSIIGHNGEAFDIKWIQKRIAYHGLPPLGKLPTDDTMKQMKKVFNLNSNSLAYSAKYFGLELKGTPGGVQTWLDIMFKKCSKAMKLMTDYCEKDVIVLSQLYGKILPYIDPKQSVKASNKVVHYCPACGSDDMIKYGTYRTRVANYQKRRCNNCLKVTKDSYRIKE
jgi:DNA polymerase elongation subunit (family B)